MRFRHRTLLVLPGLLAALVLGACHDEATLAPGPEPDPVPDFSLPDVNPTSPSFGTMVSPRDSMGRISAWYFGHAT